MFEDAAGGGARDSSPRDRQNIGRRENVKTRHSHALVRPDQAAVSGEEVLFAATDPFLPRNIGAPECVVVSNKHPAAVLYLGPHRSLHLLSFLSFIFIRCYTLTSI